MRHNVVVKLREELLMSWVRAVLLVIAVGCVLAIGSALPAAAIVPQDFEVQVNPFPDMGQDVSPKCGVRADGSYGCTIDIDKVIWGESAQGTVRHTGLDLSGTISMTCDADFHMHMAMALSLSGGTTTIEDVDGSMQMSCAWLMDFGSSTMSGTIAGKGTMTEVTGTDRMLIDMSFEVNVVAGTGEFADQVGSGSWTEQQEQTMSGAAGGGGQTPPAMASRVLATAAADDGAMSLNLRKGKARAQIVELSRTQVRDDKRVLRVAVVPGASCRATATSGSRSKALGRASDSGKKGLVTLSAASLGKLSKGTWKVKVGCSYKSGGKSVSMAPDSTTVYVS